MGFVEQVDNNNNVPLPVWKLKGKVCLKIFGGKTARFIYLTIFVLLILWLIGTIQCYYVGLLFDGKEPLGEAIGAGILAALIYISILLVSGLIIVTGYCGIIMFKNYWKSQEEKIANENQSNV